MIRSLIDRALRPVFTFAGDCWGGYATGPCIGLCSGNEETDTALRSIALGGGSLAQELRSNGARTAPTHDEFFALHFRGDTK